MFVKYRIYVALILPGFKVPRITVCETYAEIISRKTPNSINWRKFRPAKYKRYRRHTGTIKYDMADTKLIVYSTKVLNNSAKIYDI